MAHRFWQVAYGRECNATEQAGLAHRSERSWLRCCSPLAGATGSDRRRNPADPLPSHPWRSKRWLLSASHHQGHARQPTLRPLCAVLYSSRPRQSHVCTVFPRARAPHRQSTPCGSRSGSSRRLTHD
jgi:hypothetical protein